MRYINRLCSLSWNCGALLLPASQEGYNTAKRVREGQQELFRTWRNFVRRHNRAGHLGHREERPQQSLTVGNSACK